MRNPCFDDFHPSAGEPVLHLALLYARDLNRMAPQRHLALSVRVVGIASRHIPPRRLALHMHKILVVVDEKDRLRRIDNLPHCYRCNLDRIAV